MRDTARAPAVGDRHRTRWQPGLPHRSGCRAALAAARKKDETAREGRGARSGRYQASGAAPARTGQSRPAPREALPPSCPPSARRTCQEAADVLGDSGAVHAAGGGCTPRATRLGRAPASAPPGRKQQPRPTAATARPRAPGAGLRARRRGFASGERGFSCPPRTAPQSRACAPSLCLQPLLGVPRSNAPATRDHRPRDLCRKSCCVRSPCGSPPLVPEPSMALSGGRPLVSAPRHTRG